MFISIYTILSIHIFQNRANLNFQVLKDYVHNNWPKWNMMCVMADDSLPLQMSVSYGRCLLLVADVSKLYVTLYVIRADKIHFFHFKLLDYIYFFLPFMLMLPFVALRVQHGIFLCSHWHSIASCVCTYLHVSNWCNVARIHSTAYHLTHEWCFLFPPKTEFQSTSRQFYEKDTKDWVYIGQFCHFHPWFRDRGNLWTLMSVSLAVLSHLWQM